MSTTLVTGGTGLVGSRLLRRFVAADITCRGLVRAGKDLPDGVEAVDGDILDSDSLGPALQDVSAVIHLAASFRSGDDDVTRAVTAGGARNLIAATEKYAPEARFLLASTSNVYLGSDPGRPALEDDDVHPTAAYPASKVEAEAALRSSSLTWAVLRLPFVYGEQDGHLTAAVTSFTQANRHPAERLSMAHHEDIAAAFQLALTGAMDGRIVNIADDSPMTGYEMAQLVGETYPASSEPLAHPWRGVADISLARRLGFRPAVRSAFQAQQEGKL